MDALPFEYCGWNAQGLALWSRGFPALFGLISIQTIRDIQIKLMPSDAAALEGMIFRLQKDGEPFTLNVKTVEDHKTLVLHGLKGNDLDQIESYDVLWAEDGTTAQHHLDDLNETITRQEKTVQQYNTILNALPQSIWVEDYNQKQIMANTAYQVISDTVGGTFAPTLPDKETLLSLEKRVISNNQAEATQGRVIVGGKRTLMDISLIPVKDQQMLVGSAYDITEQEDLRAQLKRYVAANAELMEQLSTAIAIFSAEHRLEFYNHAYAALWGLEDQWLNTQPTLGDILEKLREMRRLPEQANFRAYKQEWLDKFTSLFDQHQDMMYLPDGMAIRMMMVPHPMGGLMMTFEDVTGRLELESSYNTLIAVQKETLDNLGEGVAVFGSNGRLKLYNPSYLKMWGLNPEDADIEPHISTLVERKKKFFKSGKTQWDTVKAALIAQAIERSDAHETLYRSDKSVLECMSVPLPDGGVMVTYRDITDSARVREALEERNQALIDAENLKTDFLANVSYQLRTPLNAISGFSEMLDHEYFGPLNERQKEYTKSISEAASHLAALIDDILDLSTIEAGQFDLEKRDGNALDVIQNVYDLTREWAGMKAIKITYKKPKEKAINASFDEKRLKQTLVNVVRSAINYSTENGRIIMGVESDSKTLIISLTCDSPQPDLPVIDAPFQPFNHRMQSDNNTGGFNTGLGLSLARNIMQLHGGDVTVSHDNNNLTILVTLPL